MTGTLAVERALAAAQIPNARIGPARTARLSRSELALYHAILRDFAGGAVPTPPALARESERLGLDLSSALTTLAREDLVHTDAAGAITVAYPFSGRPTAHRVQINGHDVYAMCAIDALGMAPMFNLPVTINSHDPLTGSGIGVVLAPGGEARWSPDEAVVVAGSACAGASFSGCCQVVNFFAAPANAERYLAEHAEVNGHVISIADAIEAGRRIFADVFAAGQ